MESLDFSTLNSKTLPMPESFGQKEVRSKKTDGRIYYALFVLLLGSVISLAAGANITKYGFVATFLVSILIALYVGWQTLGEYKLFKNTQVCKIDSGISGLCEVQANFESEDGSFVLNPVTGNKCLYYSIELHLKTEGRHSTDTVQWSKSAAVPALLTDGTSYLYCDYGNAEMGFYQDVYPIQNEDWDDVNRRNAILNLLNSSTVGGRFDFTGSRAQ